VSESAVNGGAAARELSAEVLQQLEGVSLETGDAVWRHSAAGAVPAAVALPASVEQVEQVVAAARRAKLGLVATGSGTHLDIGWTPRAYDLALCTRKLDRILAHDAGDLTVRVQAGVKLEALDAALAEKGQWLPLDPAAGAEMTVGGLIAADRSGPCRAAHGKVRELLIGISVVGGENKLLKGGGQVVKNVAGYDLPKLFVGSYGSLGVVVEATFKTRPRPACEALLHWPRASVDDAVRGARELAAAPLSPSALEAVNEAAAETLGLEGRAALLIALAGSAAEVAAEEEWLVEASGGAARRYEDARAPAVLGALRDFPLPANDEALVARISLLPGALADVLERVEVEARRRAVVVEIAAHAASGVAWCQMFAPRSAALADFAEWLRVWCRGAGGHTVFEFRPEELRPNLDPWGFHGPTLRLMAGVKQALDPDAVFSPGRFVGGL